MIWFCNYRAEALANKDGNEKNTLVIRKIIQTWLTSINYGLVLLEGVKF